jgi:glycosyltransferase involved in cell wall biosynthesis
MNVGVMVSGQTPQAGGGYTFEDEILQAFYRLSAESSHCFHLVGHAPVRPAHLDFTGLPWLSLHRTRAERRRLKLSRARNWLRRKLRLATPARKLDLEAYPDFRTQPVDLLCYLTPLVRPIADIPYITNVWDVEHRLQPFFPEVSLHGEWESRERRCRAIFQRATYVLTPNSRGKEELVGYFGLAPERVRVFPHPTPEFARKEAGRPHDARSLAHLGVTGDFLFYPAQFWAHKNHFTLLLALRRLKERHGQSVQLVLTGSDKGNRAFIERRVREIGLERDVIFAGFVSREDLTALYRQARALVYPSFCGPENLPPLEAFALGCPVIASDIPGARVQLGDAAMLVEAGNADAWADAMARVGEDAAWRGMLIERGHQRAELYTADHFVRDLFRLFDEFEIYRRTWPMADDAR